MISRETINDVLYEALSLGGDFAEVFVEDRRNTHYQMISGRLEKGVRGNDFGVGIRVYFGHSSVYTYSNSTDKETLVRLVREAVYKRKAQSIHQLQAQESRPFVNVHGLDLGRTGSDLAKADLMRRTSEEAMGYSKEITQVIVNYVDHRQDVLIANTEGLLAEDTRMRTRISVSATAEHNGGLQTGMTNTGAHQDFSFYEHADTGVLAREASRIAVTMSRAGYAPSGKMPVIIGSGFGGVLFHEASGHGLEATSVAKGISVYSGKEGEQVASKLVTAIDDGTIQGAWGSQNIDDEGQPTQKNVLIDKGVLTSYMVDRLNGRIMDRPSTGSGRRQSYRYAPTSRMTNTYIDNGQSTFDEIVSSTDTGLYAKYLGGGSVNPATGEFNFAVMEGYLIKNGKIAEPVRGATLIGTGFDVLKSIDMVGSDLAYGQGMCGSISGSLPVNVGQPTVRVSQITVGGRSE